MIRSRIELISKKTKQQHRRNNKGEHLLITIQNIEEEPYGNAEFLTDRSIKKRHGDGCGLGATPSMIFIVFA